MHGERGGRADGGGSGCTARSLVGYGVSSGADTRTLVAPIFYLHVLSAGADRVKEIEPLHKGGLH